MSDSPIVYLTSPIGMHGSNAEWKLKAREELMVKDIFTYWSSRNRDAEFDTDWRLYDQLMSKSGRYSILRDRDMLMRSSVVLAHFAAEPHTVSLQSCIELGWADAWGKPVVATFANEDAHSIPAVIETVTRIANSLEEAIGDVIDIVERSRSAA